MTCYCDLDPRAANSRAAITRRRRPQRQPPPTCHRTRSKPTMAGQYWFPSMSHEEIVDSFSEWGITINTNDLKRPTSDFVTNIYAACLQQVTALSADSLQGPIQRELAKLDSPVCCHLFLRLRLYICGVLGSIRIRDGTQLSSIPSASSRSLTSWYTLLMRTQSAIRRRRQDKRLLLQRHVPPRSRTHSCQLLRLHQSHQILRAACPVSRQSSSEECPCQ